MPTSVETPQLPGCSAARSGSGVTTAPSRLPPMSCTPSVPADYPGPARTKTRVSRPALASSPGDEAPAPRARLRPPATPGAIPARDSVDRDPRSGLASRLRAHAGWFRRPQFEAIRTTVAPSATWRPQLTRRRPTVVRKQSRNPAEVRQRRPRRENRASTGGSALDAIQENAAFGRAADDASVEVHTSSARALCTFASRAWSSVARTRSAPWSSRRSRLSCSRSRAPCRPARRARPGRRGRRARRAARRAPRPRAPHRRALAEAPVERIVEVVRRERRELRDERRMAHDGREEIPLSLQAGLEQPRRRRDRCPGHRARGRRREPREGLARQVEPVGEQANASWRSGESSTVARISRASRKPPGGRPCARA